jgi:hypothetical protein
MHSAEGPAESMEILTIHKDAASMVACGEVCFQCEKRWVAS